MSFGHAGLMTAAESTSVEIRNEFWTFILEGTHNSSTSVEIRNEFWTNLPVGRGEPSTSVEIRNEFWTPTSISGLFRT